jgi:hypothetical protein
VGPALPWYQKIRIHNNKKRKLQASVLNEHIHKNPQQNTARIKESDGWGEFNY